MSSLKTRRRRKSAEKSQALNLAGRDLSTAGIMFHQAVADRLGLNPTDHKCLDLVQRRDGAPAGELAELTGLTTGAVTGIIDRLERAGFVVREEHPTHRRKVIVRAVRERLDEVCRLFVPLAEGMAALCRRYSPAELDLILDYMARSAEVLRRETKRLRLEAEGAP